MKIFHYSFFSKLLYWYVNYIVSVFLLVHLGYLISLSKGYGFVFPAIIYGVIIYLLNRNYIKRYSLFPRIIELNNEKITARSFLKGNDKEIRISEIYSITGNIFAGNMTKPLIIKSENGEFEIGIHSGIKNYDELIKILLSNVRTDLYKELLDKLNNKKASKK